MRRGDARVAVRADRVLGLDLAVAAPAAWRGQEAGARRLRELIVFLLVYWEHKGVLFLLVAGRVPIVAAGV